MTNRNWSKVIDDKVKEAKQRGAKKRGWVVLRKSWLTSSINYRMELDEMAVFSKLIVMADEFGPVPGLISDNDCRPMPHEYLAHQACCPLEVLESVIRKGIEDDSLYENSHGIFMTHFDAYQFTEYDRQKPYRERQKEAEKIIANEDKKLHGQFNNVSLNEDEKQKLIERFGEVGFSERVEGLSIGMESKGYKYKSHYAAILSWDRKDKRDGTHKQGAGQNPTEYTNPDELRHEIEDEG